MQRLVVAPYGPPALDALAELVTEAQVGDPFAPVTVVVPTVPLSVSVRRALGRRTGGLANVRVLALAELARLLATPAEADDPRAALTSTSGATPATIPGKTARRNSRPYHNTATPETKRPSPSPSDQPVRRLVVQAKAINANTGRKPPIARRKRAHS